MAGGKGKSRDKCDVSLALCDLSLALLWQLFCGGEFLDWQADLDGGLRHLSRLATAKDAGRMTLLAMGHRPGATLFHWPAGLGAVERLDLALFIDREDDGMSGRIDIETDDVAQLVDEVRVGGEFELFHPVRLQAVRARGVGRNSR
jgi:hypothetical protein